MARATTRDNGNLALCLRVGTAEDDLVFRVEGEGRVGDSEGVEGGLDEVGGIRKEVFCCRC